MEVSQLPPRTITLLDEQCKVVWGSTSSGWCWGTVVVHTRPLAQLEWYFDNFRPVSIERAVKALRSYRASGCRWSLTDRRNGNCDVPLDLESCLLRLTPRAELTSHRHNDNSYWRLETGTVDAAFLLWNVQLAEDVARRVRAARGNLELAGKLRPPVYRLPDAMAA